LVTRALPTLTTSRRALRIEVLIVVALFFVFVFVSRSRSRLRGSAPDSPRAAAAARQRIGGGLGGGFFFVEDVLDGEDDAWQPSAADGGNLEVALDRAVSVEEGGDAFLAFGLRRGSGRAC
jgi:hypothetical protein